VFSPGLVLRMYLISCLLIYVYKLDNICCFSNRRLRGGFFVTSTAAWAGRGPRLQVNRLQVTGEGGRRVVARIGFAQGSCKRKGSPRRALLWRHFLLFLFQVSGCGRVEGKENRWVGRYGGNWRAVSGQRWQSAERPTPSIQLGTFAAPVMRLQSSLIRSFNLGIRLLPEDIRATYQIEERHHACAILKLDFPAEWDDLIAVLRDFTSQESAVNRRREAVNLRSPSRSTGLFLRAQMGRKEFRD